MTQVTKVGQVVVPVSDKDQAIAFYTQKLGFTLVADLPFGDGDRWIEVAPPGGGVTVAFGPADMTSSPDGQPAFCSAHLTPPPTGPSSKASASMWIPS